MKFLVGSIFSDCKQTELWYDLQLKHLNETLEEFDHAVYFNGKKNVYRKSILIGSGDHNPSSCCKNHVSGLNAVMSFFNSKKNEYDAFLILDSDCFPFQLGWAERLMNIPYSVAAPVRHENLDIFPHPCFVFMKKEGLDQVSFEYSTKKNLLGQKFKETNVNCNRFFPMIRSNEVNLHPIMFGIYWNMVYHHGAGSRSLKFRISDPSYSIDNKGTKYDERYDPDSVKYLNESCINILRKKPSAFLEYLSNGGNINKVNNISIL